MRRLLLSVALLSFGCGGGSPTQPSPSPAPTTATISGLITTPLTGVPVAGATLAFLSRTVTTDAAGAWSLDGQNANASLSVTISAPGYITRETTIKTEQGRTGVEVDLIKNAAPFSLTFFRQAWRNG